MLKRFRNAVFHAQRDYMSKKFVDFMAVGPDSAMWIRSLHSELGRFFLAWSRAHQK